MLGPGWVKCPSSELGVYDWQPSTSTKPSESSISGAMYFQEKMRDVSLDRQSSIWVCTFWRQTCQGLLMEGNDSLEPPSPCVLEIHLKILPSPSRAPERSKHRKWIHKGFLASCLLLKPLFQAALLAVGRQEGTESWQRQAWCGAWGDTRWVLAQLCDQLSTDSGKSLNCLDTKYFTSLFKLSSFMLSLSRSVS